MTVPEAGAATDGGEAIRVSAAAGSTVATGNEAIEANGMLIDAERVFAAEVGMGRGAHGKRGARRRGARAGRWPVFGCGAGRGGRRVGGGAAEVEALKA